MTNHSETDKRSVRNPARYEYHSQPVSGSMMPMYTDNYQYFGWELEGKSMLLTGIGKYMLRFKRDRKIINRTELTRLQRQFDSQIKEIEVMEQSKLLTASVVAYSIGIIGSAFLAGSVFAFLSGVLILCILLAVPGFLGWGISYPCYLALGKRKAAEVQPYIDQKYEEIYAVCERAHGLLIS